MNITFRQLRVFTEVARQGSMNGAAAALHLTPQAVSLQIKEIESQVELPLFDREGRQVVLSTAGEYLLAHAKRLLAGLKDADDTMARFKRLEQGRLSVGLVSSASCFVPQLLARFHNEHPGIEVQLRVFGNRGQLVAAIEAGEVDLSVMGSPPKEIATSAEAFAVNPMVFVAAPDHPLLGMHPPLAALRAYPFIVRERGSGTRAAMESFFTERNFEPHITMEMANNETIKQSVMAGLGVSFLSLHTMGLELRGCNLGVLDVEGAPVMRTWHIVRLQAKLLSPVAEAFRYFMIERGGDYLRAHDAGLLAPESA